MAVMVGSARSDERGKAHGGKAGDQKGGREVSTQAWYKHSKGWRVLRCYDPAMADRAAHAMELACASPLIGYDQYQRDTLMNAVKDKGYDIAKLAKPVETDCSALVRVCLAYAFGRDVVTGKTNFVTGNMCGRLLATGLMVELTGDRYTCSPDYLRRGDVLCTKTSGHTVMVLSDGNKADAMAAEPAARLLKNGCEGADVAQLQRDLIQLGHDCGKWGADGDFGDATEMAVAEFQRAAKLEVDGVVGEKTRTALDEALAGLDAPAPAPEQARIVRIHGGQCWVRTAPTTEAGYKLGTVSAGAALPFGGEISPDGWLLVEYKGQNAWVSGKYGRVEV